jgi:hypothetical protein
MILDCFDVLILKIVFLKKYIILIHFQAKKHFKKQLLLKSQTLP